MLTWLLFEVLTREQVRLVARLVGLDPDFVMQFIDDLE